VQAAQYDLASAAAIPLRQLECPPRERQMHGDPNDLGHGRKGWPAVQQVFIPIANLPVFGCGCCEASESQGRGEHVLAETGVWILRIKRIDQQRIARPHHAGRNCSIEKWRPSHFGRAPPAGLRHPQLLYNAKYALSRIFIGADQRRRWCWRPLRSLVHQRWWE